MPQPRRREARFSIATKVTLVVVLLAGLLLVGVGYAGVLASEQRSVESMKRDAEMLAGVIKKAAETAVRDHGTLGAIADVASRERPVIVIFYGPNGRVVAPVPVEEKPVVDARARRVIERRQPEGEFLQKQRRPTAYAYRTPLFAPKSHKVAGVLELRLSLDRAQPKESALSWLFIVIGVLLTLFTLVTGFYVSRAIGRPVAALMHGMDDVISGDLTATVPLERDDEIGRIAYRFNEMTAQLRAAQLEIKKSADTRLSLEQRLRQSEKLATIGQLSAEIAHEVGTPLNVIGGRARVLERKADKPEAVQRNARIIADQAARITRIIQQMLDLARARAPERGEVALARIVDDTMAFLEYQLESSSVRIRRDVPGDLPAVWGDADLLQQVVLNLMLNAIQAMPAGGELLIRAQAVHRRKGGLDLAPPEPYVALAFSDDGPGIEDDARARIFEPFYSTKGRGEGTGLGLTVVHGIVKEHDGWIEVDSGDDAEDGEAQPGTTFCVYLPVADARRDQAPLPEPSQEQLPDDEPDGDDAAQSEKQSSEEQSSENLERAS
ncbi:MAG: HAMP domain-containing protein [Myxococcales bacterium]|nr:HAMP domain-containing protein [Myxococcales bacterium]